MHDPTNDPPTRPCKAFIIEVGYTAETRYEERLRSKSQQHAQLCQLLEASGYEPVVHTILLGTTGGIFAAQHQMLAELGMERSKLRKLSSKLHVHGIGMMHDIIKLRRVKESHMQEPGRQRKKKPPDK